MNIKWPERNIISRAVENQLRKILVVNGDYNFFPDKDIPKLQKQLDVINKKNSTTITCEIAFAVRIVLLRDKVIKKSGRIRHLKHEINAHYKHNIDILELSKKYDYAPYGLFRIILDARGYSKRRISDIGRDPSKLNERDQETYQIAVKNDIIGNPDDTVPARIGLEFEKILEKYFKNNNIKFVNQDHLVEEQIKSVGRAVATPDLHFPDGISINGNLIYWIDAKSFYGGDVFYIRNSMKKQAKKYNTIYGAGAFVFKRGVSGSLKIDAMLLSM